MSIKQEEISTETRENNKKGERELTNKDKNSDLRTKAGSEKE